MTERHWWRPAMCSFTSGAIQDIRALAEIAHRRGRWS